MAEDWGGDTIVCPISAKTGMGVDNLLEMVALTAEVGELKANPNRAASGTVIEARLDKGRGPIATLLVQNGTLHQGDIIIAGTAVGRVRVMTNDKGEKHRRARVRPFRWRSRASARCRARATNFNAVADERLARELVEQRKAEEKAKANAPVSKVSLEDLFSQIQAGEMKNLNIIVKADVQGSVEAVKASLEKISNDEVRVRVIHGGGRRDQRERRHARFHLERHHRRLQRPSRRSGPRQRGPRPRRYADVPRHLRLPSMRSRRP